MERRQRTRIPVNVNAVLLAKETMPRGCRVRDVSQRGMLLHWGAGKRMPSFSEGDTVEIHLSLRRQSDRRQSLSIPAVVRRVNEDSIGVEFPHLMPELVELIASCGISETDELKASIAQRPAAPADARLRNPGAGSDGPGVTPAGQGYRSLQDQGHKRLHWGPLLLVLAVGILSGAYVLRLGDRLSALEAAASGHAREIAAMQERLAEHSKLQKKLAYLTARVQRLDHTLAAHEQRLIWAAPAQQTPGPDVDSAVVATTLARSPGPDARAVVNADREAHSSVHAEQPAEALAPDIPTGETRAPAADETGPWVINLLSSPNKAAVDRFAGQARLHDIAVEQHRVTVKGRQFWRVQVTGFATAKEARSYGELTQKKLGLKDVWIFKRPTSDGQTG